MVDKKKKCMIIIALAYQETKLTKSGEIYGNNRVNRACLFFLFKGPVSVQCRTSLLLCRTPAFCGQTCPKMT